MSVVFVNDAFTGFAGFIGIGDRFDDSGRGVGDELLFDLSAGFGTGAFGKSHGTDFDISALAGLDDFLFQIGERLAQLIAVGVLAESFRDLRLIHNDLTADDFGTPVEQK